MASKGCKCDPHEICEECPEWIFTLADLIMCMMGLFVLLWVLKPSGSPGSAASAEQTDKLNEQIAAIRSALGYIPPPDSTDPVDLKILSGKLNQIGLPKGPGDGGETNNPKEGAEGTDERVTTIRLSTTAAEGGRLEFSRGDVGLTPEVKSALNELAKQIRGHRQVVMIKGHASLDDLGEGATAQQKMDLSLKRAQVVRDYLEALGASADTLRVLGCSVFEPVRQRTYGPDALRANRRVEVEVTTTLVPELQDPGVKGRAKQISPE